MTMLDLFSGIGAFSIAAHRVGIETVAFCEINPFCRKVLAARFPGVPIFEDVTTLTAESLRSFGVREVTFLAGGWPCQGNSVAGKRGGHADERSGLFSEIIRLAEELHPRWLLLENVPGLVSVNGGADFADVIGELRRVGYMGCVRRLDAQHFGLAQRRSRLFFVGGLGDAGKRAVHALLEGGRRYPAPRREAGQRVAGTFNARASAGGGLGTDFECDGGLIPAVANPLTQRMYKGVNTTCDEGQTMVAPPLTGNPYGDHESREGLLVAGTVSSKWAKGTGGPAGDECQNLIAHSLTAEGFDASEDGTGRGTPLVALPLEPLRFQCDGCGGTFYGEMDTPCPTCRGFHTGAVTYPPSRGGAIAFSSKDHGADAQDDLAPTLRAGVHSGSHENGGVPPAVAFQPRYYTRDNKTGGAPSATVDLTNCAKAGDSATAIYLPETSPLTRYNKGEENELDGQIKGDPASALRALRKEVGEEAFAEWGLGILDSLQPQEVLRQEVHGSGVRCEADEIGPELDDGALSREEVSPARALREVRRCGRERRASQGWELSKQCSRELGAYLPLLSRSRASRNHALLGLWEAAEGLGILREALSTLQEVGRPANGQDEPASTINAGSRVKGVGGGALVRRLSPT